MKLTHLRSLILLTAAIGVLPLRADERRFTYVYEPETLPAGAFEFENWVTLRTQRSAEVGQDNFNRWDLRQEVEYGVTDRYTVAFYLNERSDRYEVPSTGEVESSFDFKGVSLENRYNLLNPAEHRIGFSFYLEGRYAGDEAALEQRLIFGQRHGRWKWALNLEHETEWEDNLEEVEGEFGASVGITRELGKSWSLGVEVRNVNHAPEYERVSNSAIYLGPVLAYRQERFWAALTVMPQVYGWNFDGDPDGHAHLELTSNEKLQVRFLFGLDL